MTEHLALVSAMQALDAERDLNEMYTRGDVSVSEVHDTLYIIEQIYNSAVEFLDQQSHMRKQKFANNDLR